MTRSADGLAVRYDYWRPRGTRPLAALVAGVDALFDRVYSSRLNPLHRTGTLAALFLTIAAVTGFYLIFVYEIGRPYESIVAIQRDVFLGRWLRALHRYASDAAVVAVALHVVRLTIQGKTWGARTLAWITGVMLTGMMVLSAFTGFVLVWDELGQKAAIAGARILRLLPLFSDPPDRAFVGSKPAPSAFFFMNLFLHVAVPLGMIAFLWLHTSKLARAAWFPEKKVSWGVVIAFAALAVAWPAPLPPAADLLAIPGRVATDWFYAFWLPLADASPGVALVTVAAVGALLLAVPWLVKPRRALRPAPAWSDPEKCEGCEQCMKDCPYDAIHMVAGMYPDKHALRAEVLVDACVSCGLCAASCASLAIGPASRTAWHQLAAARQLVAGTPDAATTTLVVACRNNGDLTERLRRLRVADSTLASFDVDCAGTLHPGTVSYLASHFAETVIVTCPPQNCVHREGVTLTDARILLEQRPAVPGRIAQQRVRLVHHSSAEWNAIVAAIGAANARAAAITSESGASVLRTIAAAAFTIVLLAAIALGSRWPQGVDVDHGVLRLGWQLAGQVRQTCRDLTPEELAQRPVHMRQARECTSEALSYDVNARVDGRVMLAKIMRPAGVRGDRPLTIEDEIPVAPGEHVVTVTFTPDDVTSTGKSLAIERRVRFDAKRVVLVTYEDGALVVK